MMVRTYFLVGVGIMVYALGMGELWAAKLFRYRGKVTLNEVVSPPNGTPLKDGDRLVSKGKSSFFIVKYDDGSRFLVRDGELVIDQLKKKFSKVELKKGTFLSFVQPKQSHSLTVKTRTASLGVRGTKFWVTESLKETYLCVCEGSVEVKNQKDSIVVSANEDLRVQSQSQKLEKALANNFMWNMAVEGFQELGFTIPSR